MKTYALIGSSGTGKSHRASYLAFKHNIPFIIDDGLLISGSSVLAGTSAKRESTKIGAVKRAIFHNDAHADEVKKIIAGSGAAKILILGTSQKMVLRIAQRLDLPAPGQIIKIEDIASPRAISKALEMRNKENRHVIPIPTFAIKKDFPGYLIDPLRSFWGKSHREDPKKVVIERSIVRPIFSSFGKFYIAENVVAQIVAHVGAKVPGVSRIGKVEVISKPDGASLEVDVNIYYGKNIPGVLQEVQRVIKETVEYLTGFNIDSILITARRIELPESSQV
ncbi:MAG: Asp23/Gls24 family envelope stress response protein [Bacillota bacterium]|nr:Asp23/Gls24 family envelope stress response protein [Bacillota bacterium]MDW7682772.1 Asp23/Gls24 family envelope stress response protein [Bacillota bacterium]